MKPVKGKIISIAALVYVFLSVAALLAAVPVQASEVMKNSAEKIYIEGAASVDGGEWTQTVPDRTECPLKPRPAPKMLPST